MGSWPNDAVNEVWRLVRAGRPGPVLALVAAHGPEGPLQIVGDGALLALSKGIDAVETARAVATGLRDRDWDGDLVLADELDASTGDGPVPLRRTLAVDLESLAMAMESDIGMGSAFLDLESGDIHYPDWEDGIDASLDDERPVEWIPHGGRQAWHDMASFAGLLPDQLLGERLREAIEGRGAFARFKAILGDDRGLVDTWHAFNSERARGRARAWLADIGFKPRPGGF